MNRTALVLLAISTLVCACSTPRARDPILVEDAPTFVWKQIATVSSAGVWYLGSAEELHHFRIHKVPGGSVYFAVRRSDFTVPVEFPLDAKEPLLCLDWFTMDPKQEVSEEDAKVIKRIMAVPLREAQSAEEKR